MIIISFYNFSKNISLKLKRLSDTRGESVTNKKYGFAVHFVIKS